MTNFEREQLVLTNNSFMQYGAAENDREQEPIELGRTIFSGQGI